MLLSVEETHNSPQEPRHVPVLLEATIDYLCPENGGLFLDGTFGGGGHSRALLEKNPNVLVIAIDQDPEAAERAKPFKETYGKRFEFYGMNFSQIDSLKEKEFDGVLFDYGLSSFQLDQAERGFSFRLDAPLDMRMNNQAGMPASEFLETASREELIRAIREYGEEPAWRRVVEAIIDARGSGLLSRTHSFAQVIEEALGSAVCNRLKINPATRSFQGVRIAINKELESITEGLESAFERLKVGGVLVAISFHSLEDRIVKRFFRRLAGRPEHRKDNRLIEERTVLGKMISTKAVKADEAEICKNPRSRSARMRGIRKLGAEMGLGIANEGSQS